MSGTHPKPPILKVNEKLVFEFLSVDEALDRLALASASRDIWTKESENGDGRMDTSLDVLGSLILIEGEETHRKNICSAGSSWLLTLLRATMVNDDDREEAARRMTVDSARELGGSAEQLGNAFERVWKMSFCILLLNWRRSQCSIFEQTVM